MEKPEGYTGTDKDYLFWEKEIARCKKDARYFYNNYFLVNGKKPPYVTIKKWKEREKAYKLFNK